MKKRSIKLKDNEMLLFWTGATLGISGGIFSNIFTNSAFTLINNSCKTKLCYYGSYGLMTASFLIILIIILFMIKQVKRINKR